MPSPYDMLGKLSSSPINGRLQEYLRAGDTTPYRADLDITSNCNYRCRHCGDRAKGLLHRGGFTRYDLATLVEDLESLRVMEVCLIGGGEPTCSPHIGFVLEALKSRGISVGLTTNGSNVTPELAQTLARTADWVRFSIDAATEESFEKIHHPLGHVRLEDVHRNLKGLAAAMPGKVGVSFLILEDNVREIAQAAEQAKSLGAAHIRYRFANHPLTGETALPDDTAEIERGLAGAAAFADPAFDVSIADSLTTVLSPDPDSSGCPFERCHAQALSTTITGYGNVYLCSKWRGEAWACLGNLGRERLPEIWHGPRRRKIVDDLRPCQTCARVYCHGQLLNSVMEKVEAGRRIQVQAQA